MPYRPHRTGLAALLALAALASGTHAEPTALRVEGTSFVVTTADGTELRSPDLVGAELTIAVHGRLHNVRIDAVEHDTHAANTTASLADRIWLHSFSMQVADGSWQPVCGPDPDGRALGFPLAGRFDAAARLHPAEPGTFEIACTNSGQAKCVRFGYHPWRSTPDGVALASFYNACVLMVRGDYAGADQAKTRNGTQIDVNDRLDSQPAEFDPALQFEAGWTEEGAVCVAHPRVNENTTLEQLEAEIPRLRGRTGAVCTEAFARAHGALILNRSRP